ncbi:GxxExxY protein [Frigoriflavimonas asaccharolytica]|uniref:GxxExxY protein n=1 Tax=Frigoriflavimonas asaccharolytica TaxID=2735899 RepID=A0A8J8G7M1_9FLAO|nr:GxxExxY protein [Frigoriflavimonas asaccharolytica]NRS92165.1 GxxExxY protein [Frigoriflavimonas asaccharolytica]
MTRKEVTQLSYEITGLAIKVYKSLGPGLLESIYEECLKYELVKNGYKVQQQMIVPIIYDGVQMTTKLIVDLLVNNCIVIEIKAQEETLPVHEAQLLTYMKVLKKPQGLLINFFTSNITKSMKPFVNEYFNSLPE